MIDPINPNQNQQNLVQPQQSAEQPQSVPVQNQVFQDQGNIQTQAQPAQLYSQQPVNQSPVSVGKPEMGIAADSNVDTNIEKYVKSSEEEPLLEEEVANSGVENVNTEPKIHYSAQAAGVSKSIPDPTPAGIYSPPVFKDVIEADRVADETSVDKSLAWVAREVAKNLKKALGNKQQPAEV